MTRPGPPGQVGQDRAAQLQALVTTLVHLDEVLMTSAQMAALSGDVEWEQRYLEIEPKLMLVMTELAESAHQVDQKPIVLRIDGANQQSRELEKNVLVLIRQGRMDEAESLLFGKEYALAQGFVTEGSSRLNALLEGAVSSARVGVPNQSTMRALTMAAAVAVLLFGTLVALRAAVRWRSEVRHIKQRLAEQAHELAALSQEIDQKVLERTAKLRRINEKLRFDIEQHSEAEKQLRHNALHNVLTNLPNRILLMDRIDQCIERAKRDPEYLFAVLFMDLDDSKVVNDSLGHKVGDEMLVKISERLVSCLGALDTISRPEANTTARLGGDEFVVLLDGIREPGIASVVAERVQEAVSQTFELRADEVVTTFSVGIATSQLACDQTDDILRDADTALYRAKSLGKGSYAVFDRRMREQAVKQM